MIVRRESIYPDSLAAPWWLLREADVASLIAQHAALRHLCEELEDCADHLPDRAALACAARTSAAFAELLKGHEAVERTIFGGVLATTATGVLPARIRDCHGVDQLHAEDLHEALTIAAQMVGPIRLDTLSYMMRCLFDGCRRSIDFQEAGMLLLARNRLTLSARLALLASLTGTA